MRKFALITLAGLLIISTLAVGSFLFRDSLSDVWFTYYPSPSSESLEKACEKGNAAACGRIGVRIAFGTFGYEQNYEEAFPYLEKACSGDDLWSCKELGILYEHGRGVEMNLEEAKRLYEMACTEEVLNACEYAQEIK